MKLLVFAHKPPPHHGQSYMVQLMLEGFGGDRRRVPRNQSAPASSHGIECYHVNARLSRHLEDIGEFRPGKLLLLLRYCLEAIWCRFRYDVPNLYYIPGPGKKSALYRDWLVMALCRPFFRRVILHWHAAGLGKWLETAVQINTRAITWRFLKQADLSIVLSNYNLADANKLFPRRVRVVYNGIPDPCPDFGRIALPRMRSRLRARQKLWAQRSLSASELEEAGGDPELFHVLYLTHCTREKGLFDTIEGVATANRWLAEARSLLRVHLTVAGEFVNERERAEFCARIGQPDLLGPKGVRCVRYLGFVSGEAKRRAFIESDCFCFPTYYYAESFGLVVIEAMAFGLPVVTTRWRSLPEILPPDYPGLVPVRAPDKVASALLHLMTCETGERLREVFEQRFTLEKHLAALADALRSVEQPEAAPAWAGAAQPS